MLSELRVSQHRRYQCPLRFHHNFVEISNRPKKQTLFERERERKRRVRETGKVEEHYLVHLVEPWSRETVFVERENEKNALRQPILGFFLVLKSWRNGAD